MTTTSRSEADYIAPAFACEAKAGREFSDRALAAVQEYARDHKRFVTNEVRQAHPQINAHNNCAWGGVMLRAARLGIVRKAGARMASYPEGSNTHTQFVAEWESLTYQR
jgi:hypothetical protein